MFSGRLGVFCKVRLKSMHVKCIVEHHGHTIRCNGGCKPRIRKIERQLVYDLVLSGIN
jgi:hypothetical protein